MPSPIIKRFAVEGDGEFPLDVLRSDQCWPAGVDDAARVVTHYNTADPAEVRAHTVMLETVAKYAPNRQRWLSFGCRVVN